MATIVGKDPAAKKLCTCTQCASIIEYTQGEVEKHSYTDIDGSRDTSYWIVCPGCTEKVFVRGY